MGGQQSKPSKQSTEKLLDINHPQFRNAILIKKSQHLPQINIKAPIHNEKQYQDWAKMLKQVPIQHQNLMLPKEILLEKQGTCGSSFFLNIFYPQFQVLLSDQIINRHQQNNQKFQQPQLWYLVFVLIQTARNFHNKNKKVGDIRPENIFMNQQGQIKIATHMSWPFQQVNYKKTFYLNEVTYLAPQQLRDIIFQKSQSVCNPYKAQSFSVGLTCLDAAILSSSNKLYLPNQKFDDKLLNQKLNALDKEPYSQTLKSLIKSLCNMDIDKRGSCTYFYQWLQPYESYIKKLQTFQISQQPSRIKYQSGIKYQPLIKKQKQKLSQINMSRTSKKQQQVFIPISSGKFNKNEGFKFFDNNPEDLTIKKSQKEQSKVRQTFSPLTNSPEMRKTDYTPPKNNLSSKYNEKMQYTDLTLQMIDRQLQKSRRMFPS